MTTPDFTEHPDALFEANKPILGSTGQETKDNLLSVVGHGVGAPRPVQPVITMQRPAAGIVSSSGLAHYSGLTAHIHVENTDSSAQDISISFSSDGVTYEAATALISVPASGSAQIYLVCDLTTGALSGVYSYGGLTGAAATPSDPITHMRLESGTATKFVAIIYPNGGNI